MDSINIIGAGLAGSEAAWQIAKRGFKVRLYEMRPNVMTPAHHTSKFAELVCSNSLKADTLDSASGLLKQELRLLDSLIISNAEKTKIPAGGALAVDREAFSESITEKLLGLTNIEIIRNEVVNIDDREITIVATGPLTSKKLSEQLQLITDQKFLYFYDAAAPLIEADSIDDSKVFWASRYGKGTADYLNCAMSKEEYDRFYSALINAETQPLKEFEKQKTFEGCMPIEVIAKRGYKTMLFGPLRPVGLHSEAIDENKPYAVVQLRRDNAAKTLFNMVGFQTNLKWKEQKNVFRLIPGLEKAEFARFGVMHRNTFINSPKILLPTKQLKLRRNILIAGQLSGVEGYMESTASGLLAGINAVRIISGEEPLIMPRNTALGSLMHYITNADPDDFQPANINFGLLPEWPEELKDKREKKLCIANRAIESMIEFINKHKL